MYKPWDRIAQVMICRKSSGGSSKPIITEDMRAAAEVATEQWNDYQQRMAPFENKFKADMERDITPEQAKLRGAINADIAQKTTTAGAVPAGAQPGKTMMQSGLNSAIVGKAAAAGATDVTQGATNLQAQGLNTIVAMGRGQATEALQTQQQLAESSAQAALTKAKADQQTRFANEAMTANLIGQGVGAAGGVAMYGADQGWFQKPAGQMSTFDQSQQQAITQGASSGDGGYRIRNGNIYWND